MSAADQKRKPTLADYRNYVTNRLAEGCTIKLWRFGDGYIDIYRGHDYIGSVPIAAIPDAYWEAEE